MKSTLIGIVATLGLVIGIPLFFIINRGCTTGAQVINRTFDGDNMITQYEWFKQQHQDYLAIDVKIRTASDALKLFKSDSGPRKDWSFEDKQEYSRLSSILTGLEYQKQDMKSKYNARSKMVNRSIFKEGVPHELR